MTERERKGKTKREHTDVNIYNIVDRVTIPTPHSVCDHTTEKIIRVGISSLATTPDYIDAGCKAHSQVHAC